MINISIGLVALNEEKNILPLLNSIVQQKVGEDFFIKEIILVSDGSTDKTVKLAQAAKIESLKIIVHKDRKGKGLRLNEVFADFSGDVLVLLDADVTLFGEKDIFCLAKTLTDSKTDLVGGLPIPDQNSNKNLAQKISCVSPMIYGYVRDNWKGGNNLYGCHGRILALSKRFAKMVSYPKSIPGTDAFLYLKCKESGFKFVFESQAQVVYNPPANMADFVKQGARFGSVAKIQQEFFSWNIDKEFSVPKNILIKAIIRSFLKKPHISILWFLAVLWSRLFGVFKKRASKSGWDIAKSTK